MDRTHHHPARAEHVRCTYGGTGVSRAGFCAVLLDLEVVAISLVRDLRVSAVELLDSGHRFANVVTPMELRVWHPGRDRDHNEITTAFGGTIDAGTRVRLRTGGNLGPEPVPMDAMARARYRATIELLTPEREQLIVEGPVGAGCWATAGPARAP